MTSGNGGNGPATVFTVEQMRGLVWRRHDRPGDVLMQTLERDGQLVAPGCFSAMDAQIARLVRQQRVAGGKPCHFNCVYGSGWAASVMDLARPDMGFHDRTRIVAKAECLVAGAHPLPLVMDAEAGFGGVLHIPDLVRGFHLAGVAMGHLEDQTSDARFCGHLAGRTVVSAEQQEAKIRAWLMSSAAIGTSMRLMCRTDAFSASNITGGVNEIVERGKRFMSVEVVDGTTVWRPEFFWAEFDTPDPEPIADFAHRMRQFDPQMRLAINYSPNKDWGRWYEKHRHGERPPSYRQLQELGFQLVFHTILSARAAMEGVGRVFRHMADDGAAALHDLQDRHRGDDLFGDPQGLSNAGGWQVYDQAMSVGGRERYVKGGGYASGQEHQDRDATADGPRDQGDERALP